ncbi:MAG TPA: ATP-binding protein [Candidatus Limnocylindrales bacterium]
MAAARIDAGIGSPGATYLEACRSLDPVILLLQLAFYVTFAASAWRWATHRGPLELAVMGVFAPIAALFLVSLVNTFAPWASPVVRPLGIFLLLLQPWFVVHLIDQIRPVSSRVSLLVLAGCILSSLLLLTIGAGVPIVVLSVVIFFAAVQFAAAGRLANDSRRRTGVARFRLATAAAATGLFGLSIFITGAASAAGNSGGTTIQLTTRLVLLAAAIGYLIAFVPPAWLRRQAYRALAFDLMRRLVAPGAEATPGQLWSDLAVSAREILGARRVTILSAPDGLPIASAGEPEDPAAPVGIEAPPPGSLLAQVREAFRPKAGVPSRIDVPLRAEADREQLVADVEGRALFAEDDIALLSLLGSLTARAVDREEALVTLGQARSAIEESAAIKASEVRFRALLDADPNAIVALDQHGIVVWATRQAAELFGGETGALAGMPLGDLVATPHDVRSTATLDRPVYRADTTGRRLDGTHFPAEIARTPFQLEGQPFELAVISDVSWRQEAAQIRDRFLGVLSHELRTPVTSIYGGTQLLLGRGARLDAETRTELLVSVAAESERLQRMIENLVALARIERGAEFAPTRPVLLDRVIRDLIDRERQLWPEITIHLSIPSPVQMVSAEEEYLGQVVRNLLSNAAKYSGPGSMVEVEVVDGDSDGEVLVTVRDNGPGFSELEAEKLFSLYYRAAHQAAAAPGAGIGLFICKELVSIMGGRIWATARPGGGAEFGFSLPAYVDEPDPSFDTVEPRLAAAFSAFEPQRPATGSNGNGDHEAHGAVAAPAPAATPVGASTVEADAESATAQAPASGSLESSATA